MVPDGLAETFVALHYSTSRARSKAPWKYADSKPEAQDSSASWLACEVSWPVRSTGPGMSAGTNSNQPVQVPSDSAFPYVRARYRCPSDVRTCVECSRISWVIRHAPTCAAALRGRGPV